MRYFLSYGNHHGWVVSSGCLRFFDSDLSLTWESKLKMPKKMEQKLVREAIAKGLKGKRKNAFVYGTMRKTGWKPSREK